ncbi:hypothetical protein H206_05180 [Candidatus Electrothrix aarhusensis]|uniref:Uncharacterized protein n=1 Tax=Candidatus Electrothrix aarhusensis TaxID=1859131 RepID=A0A3S3UED1_9BACT|nr:hypothetical protein H206_05180 [Candidatus Electrothrix aarhusensis]
MNRSAHGGKQPCHEDSHEKLPYHSQKQGRYCRHHDQEYYLVDILVFNHVLVPFLSFSWKIEPEVQDGPEWGTERDCRIIRKIFLSRKYDEFLVTCQCF